MKAIGTLRYAREFFDAGERLKPAPSDAGAAFRSDLSPSVPVCYLLSHSVELSLKAFLYLKGYSEEELSGKDKRRGKFGHNLLELFDASVSEGLLRSLKAKDDDRLLLQLVTPTFAKKHVEYFYAGLADCPRHSIYRDLARRLIEAVSSAVDEK